MAKKTAQKGASKGGHKIKRSERDVNFKLYILRLQKQADKSMGINSGGVRIINSFIVNMLERIVREITDLKTKEHAPYARKTGRIVHPTVTPKDCQTAVRLMFYGDLGRHALNEGTKSVVSLINSKRGRA